MEIPVIKQTFHWGLDIGSSGAADYGMTPNFQAAGGVGGLIGSSYYNSSSSRDHFIPSDDANGNIIAWTSGAGVLVKKADHDAFGNEVTSEIFSRNVSKLPPFRPSTKIKDSETGLSYHGCRYYDPVSVAAHETNHIQVLFRRPYAIKEEYNAKEGPRANSFGNAFLQAYIKNTKIIKRLQTEVANEANHSPDGNHCTPGVGTPGMWAGGDAWS